MPPLMAQSEATAGPATPHDRESREGELLAVIRAFVRDLHAQHSRPIDISRSSRLERDLGIDSLGRTELILRIERAFQVRLPGTTLRSEEHTSELQSPCNLV